VFGVLAAAIGGGCNAIFGIEQHEPYPVGVGGSGASSGTGGASCTTPDDCPGADTTCSTRTCEAGLCGAEYAAADTACTEDGGQVCDGDGNCVECNTADQCDPGEECVNHLCGGPGCNNNAQDGDETDVDCGGGSCPPCANGLDCEVYSDCQSRFCDSGGGTGGASAGGAGGTGGAGGGAVGGGTPSGGTCAPCASAADCAPVTDAWCDPNTAGGTCADKVADGGPCTVGEQCLSGNCPSDDSVCCDTACNRQCEACLGAKTGGSDGTCAPATAGSDPDSECADAPGACGPDGTGCNGSATEPHCNGGTCTCQQQYTHSDILEFCAQSSSECRFRVNVETVDCATICEAGGGECIQFRNDNPNGSCGLGAVENCNFIGYSSAICICSRGCDGDPACITPFVCTNGDCI